VKSEARSELLYAFEDYRQSFRTDYMHRMLQEGIRHLLEAFNARAEMAQLDFFGLLRHSAGEGEERRARIELLRHAVQATESLTEELDGLSCAIDLEWLCTGEAASPGAPEQSGSAPCACADGEG
jgi:hypothetical protein